LEDSCKINVKKECVSNDFYSQYGCDLSKMCPSEVKRERRYIRTEIIRCKRAGVPCDDVIYEKKRRLDELSNTSASVVQNFPSCSVLETDANKIRQLRNRESAERSRLKKDLLVESLTLQVLQCNFQIIDLKEEQSWLKQQLTTGGSASPSYYTTVDDSSSVSSANTTCDEAESDSECDSVCSSGYSSLTSVTTRPIMTPNEDFCAKLHIVTPSASSSLSQCNSSASTTVTSSECYVSDQQFFDEYLLDWVLDEF